MPTKANQQKRTANSTVDLYFFDVTGGVAAGTQFQVFEGSSITINKQTTNNKMTNKQITWEQFLRRASSHFLCNPLPEGFLDLPEEDIDEFINTNKTCWFKDCGDTELYEIIEVLANEMSYLHENRNFEFDI